MREGRKLARFNLVGVIRSVQVYLDQKLYSARYADRLGWICQCMNELGFSPRVGDHCSKCGGRIEEVLKHDARD